MAAVKASTTFSVKRGGQKGNSLGLKRGHSVAMTLAAWDSLGQGSLNVSQFLIAVTKLGHVWRDGKDTEAHTELIKRYPALIGLIQTRSLI